MKNETKHTPGPWTILDRSDGTAWIEAQGSEPSSRVTICAVYETSTKLSQEPRLAHDARLIAKAPKMFEALQEIATRGPVDGYNSVSALRLRLVATQSIARSLLNSIHNGGER